MLSGGFTETVSCDDFVKIALGNHDNTYRHRTAIASAAHTLPQPISSPVGARFGHPPSETHSDEPFARTGRDSLFPALVRVAHENVAHEDLARLHLDFSDEHVQEVSPARATSLDYSAEWLRQRTRTSDERQ